MTKKKQEPKVEGGFNINGLGLGDLLGGILGNFGNIEELLNTAEKLAESKRDSEAKEKVKRMREGLGQTKGKADSEAVESQGLGGLLGQILNFVERAGNQERTQEFEIGGKKGVISQGIRIGGLGSSAGQSSEKFTARCHKPKVSQTEKAPVVEKMVEKKIQESALDVFEEENHLKVIGDMPGVNEEDIKHELRGDKTLRIYTETARRYEKEIKLPWPVNPNIALSYKNGVLEITLTKKETQD